MAIPVAERHQCVVARQAHQHAAEQHAPPGEEKRQDRPLDDDQIMVAGEPERQPDIGDARTPSDQAGVPIDGAVPHPAVVFVSGVPGPDELAAEDRPELFSASRVDGEPLGPPGHAGHDSNVPARGVVVRNFGSIPARERARTV